ncbi:MAG: hypothetical protein ABJ360_17610, partial [Roseobacter sp.]
ISSLLTRFLFLDHRYDLFVRKSCLHLSVLLLGGLYTNLEELKGRRSGPMLLTVKVRRSPVHWSFCRISKFDRWGVKSVVEKPA